MEVTDWDTRFYALAQHMATWSKDPSTRVGAVLVGTDRRDVALGYNGFPRGVIDSPDRLEIRETRHRLMLHAERNVLDNAKFDLWASTLYVTRFPCVECAKSIVSKGIVRVVCPPSVDREDKEEAAQWVLLIFAEGKVALDTRPA
jgi:dCMP deaminase